VVACLKISGKPKFKVFTVAQVAANVEVEMVEAAGV
jgi:hypothetical protein